MRISVDEKHCQGHTMCHMVAPDLFALDADGHAYVERADVSVEQENSALAGMNACPERAITVEEQA